MAVKHSYDVYYRNTKTQELKKRRMSGKSMQHAMDKLQRELDADHQVVSARVPKI